MTLLSNITHHATLYVHEQRKNLAEQLWNELQEDSPAHTLYNQTVIDIDTARSLTSWSNTPYEGGKTALISFHTITIPAQNALLKVLEDPRDGVRFILVTSNKDALIPTLLSRLQIQTTEITKDTTGKKRAELFLKTPSQERMKLPEITELLGKVDEEGRKDREAIKAFILQLALVARTHENLIKYTPHILETSSYASDSSSSGKALLEYLALLLPEL